MCRGLRTLIGGLCVGLLIAVTAKAGPPQTRTFCVQFETLNGMYLSSSTAEFTNQLKGKGNTSQLQGTADLTLMLWSQDAKGSRKNKFLY